MAGSDDETPAPGVSEGGAAAPGGVAVRVRRSRVVTGLAAAGVTVAAALCGAAAVFAVAKVAAAPAVVLGAGMAAFLAVGHAGAALVAARRAWPGRRRAVRLRVFVLGSVLPGALLAWAALVPRPPGVAPAAPVAAGAEGVREFFVEAGAGARLRVVKLAGRGPERRVPIVVVHGGPGVPELEDNVRAFAPLAARGWDVYLYAQLGTADSTRLADPRGYTRERGVADLESLRARLGLDAMVLFGHSYGGELAARYLAAHPGRVARLVLTSPGPLDPADRSGDLVGARLDAGRRARLYVGLLAPRPLLGYLLLQSNPSAAHAFMPDAEADARNDAVVTLTEPALHCRGAAPALRPVRGTGFYTMQYPQSATAPRPADPRAALRGLRTPTLVVKGSCDYLSWRSAVAYRELLPGARLVYLPGAGHNVHQDRPREVLAAVEAFLEGGPPPIPAYEGDGPPAGYEGPA
ncbi:alpha/beta hydrolase [Nonomuraea pusilla]|uniref:alpha/beta fold hydrolase n=1 Tax=Nonomuraea pusilla TaxID=46177 RepID=UPI003329B45A